MTGNIDLERRRDQARRAFAHLASQAQKAGCESLARRLRILGWRVGSLSYTSTPPGLADKLAKRLPRLIAQAKADPRRSFLELAPAPRPTRQQIRNAQAHQAQGASSHELRRVAS